MHNRTFLDKYTILFILFVGHSCWKRLSYVSIDQRWVIVMLWLNDAHFIVGCYDISDMIINKHTSFGYKISFINNINYTISSIIISGTMVLSLMSSAFIRRHQNLIQTECNNYQFIHNHVIYVLIFYGQNNRS